MRVAELNSNRVELQIAVRVLLPARGKGPAIWLAGVSHVGERGYYEALQERLDSASVVLYEGISAAAAEQAEGRSAGVSPGLAAAAGQGAPGSSQSALQDTLATSLGLVFQLDAIDYAQPNFRNSDLTVGELRDLMARQSAAGTTGQGGSGDLDRLLEFMQGNSFMSSVVQFALRLLGASPKLQGLGRLALMDMIDEIQGDPERLGQMAPELKQLLQVLVQERNKKVLSDLKAECHRARAGASVAVFYGTAHMPDLEQRVCRELGYRPASEVWLTAFGVDLQRSGISAADRQLLRSLIGGQFKATPPEARR